MDMKIELSNGKPRGNGLFLVSHANDDSLELISIEDGVVFSYPQFNVSIPLESYDVHGWKKLDVVDAPHN